MRISRYQLRPERMLVTAALNCQEHLGPPKNWCISARSPTYVTVIFALSNNPVITIDICNLKAASPLIDSSVGRRDVRPVLVKPLNYSVLARTVLRSNVASVTSWAQECRVDHSPQHGPRVAVSHWRGTRLVLTVNRVVAGRGPLATDSLER